MYTKGIENLNAMILKNTCRRCIPTGASCLNLPCDKPVSKTNRSLRLLYVFVDVNEDGFGIIYVVLSQGCLHPVNWNISLASANCIFSTKERSCL